MIEWFTDWKDKRIAELQDDLEKRHTAYTEAMSERGRQIAELEQRVIDQGLLIKEKHERVEELKSDVLLEQHRKVDIARQLTEANTLIEAQKREIEVLHDVREDAERLKAALIGLRDSGCWVSDVWVPSDEAYAAADAAIDDARCKDD